MVKIFKGSDEERILRKDRTVIRAVPYVVVISAIFGLFMVFIGPWSVGRVFLRFCSSFVIGFAVLGIYSFIHRDRGVLDWRIVAAILLLIPLIISVTLFLLDTYLMPGMMNFLNEYISFDSGKAAKIFFFSYSTTILMVLTCHGVVSTVVAYFRNYTAKIYLSIEKIKNDETDTGRSRISRWIYNIPDIIDVRCIELEPAPDDGKFPMRMFAPLAFSIFALGLIVSSYIFLNPIFEKTFSLEEAVIVTVVLTFFVPVLVIPWFITRDTGAKIKSQARDYYLWKGMKKRLYEGFFAFVVLLSLFAISMYIGYDLVRASYTYLAYIAITAFLSLMYAFVYSNHYHKWFRKGIIKNFNDAKK